MSNFFNVVSVAKGDIPTALRSTQTGTVVAQASLPNAVSDNPAEIMTSPSDVVVRSSEKKAIVKKSADTNMKKLSWIIIPIVLWAFIGRRKK